MLPAAHLGPQSQPELHSHNFLDNEGLCSETETGKGKPERVTRERGIREALLSAEICVWLSQADFPSPLVRASVHL